MDNIFTGRHRNVTVLTAVLAIQFFGLGAQIKRAPANGGESTPLIRTWAIRVFTPFEKAFVHTETKIHDTFTNYFYLRNVRRENAMLREQLQQVRLQQVRLQEDAAQAHRLQSLLQFKEQFISETVAAQVIGTSGNEESRLIYIDKGTADGLRDNMAVITPDGVVGKVAKAYKTTSTVLLISDQTWGAGAILTSSRLQGIVKGTMGGAVEMQYVMLGETVQNGESIITSGGDRIFPKGLPVGTVKEVGQGREWMKIRVQPAADLNRLEEVLIITKIVEKEADPNDVTGPIRASDILAQRLPAVPEKTDQPAAAAGTATQPAANATAPAQKSVTNPTPAANKPAPTATKPATTNSGAAVKPANAAGTKPADDKTKTQAKPQAANPQGH